MIKNVKQKHLITIAITTVLLVSACGESTSSSSGEGYADQQPIETGFDEQALIANLVDNVISPTFDRFVDESNEQTQLVDAYCQAEQSFADGLSDASAVAQAKDAAREGWKVAMSTWQQAETMLLGPLLENDNLLRNNIYSWPIVNSCAVDYDVMFFQTGEVNGSPYDITKRTSSRKGLAALEYLLFNDDLATSCESAGPDGWHNQSESYRKIARCQFAVEVALDIHNNANDLVFAWSNVGGYAEQLKTAGSANSVFNSEHEAVNRISDAMFYLDKSTKDGKLAEPLGLLVNECGTGACVEAVESRYAQQSISHIINNLIGFDRLLTGDNGTGFVDFLINNDASEVADDMTSDVQTAISGAQAYQQSLSTTLIENREQVVQTHTDIKAITDKLKTDFINNLALELPKTSAGDND
ncbi:imelysin family protein [Thalassotalea sp. G2M2-11]|uniref:imelysin family protein n=1 Tax=Thalassotalea sp. G2M2-11 TaxID=2787627 RepID=UPI0019D1AD72|nr:imelysin family protein [Thalassotalea sp. G2M2-11]